MNQETETLNPHKNDGFKRILKAGVNSINGIGSTFKHEAAFRQEAILGACLMLLCCFLDVTPLERAMLFSTIWIIFIVELLNSAIEWATDYISLEIHPYAKRIKDMGSAAVLISLINFAVVWTTILYPHFFPGS